MIKKIIYISVEVKSREYLPKLFFASRAISKGFDCFIGDKIAIAKAINFFGPGIYFYKSINHYDTNHIKRVKKNNLYVAQDEEAGFAKPNDKEFNKFITYRSSRENVKLIDRFYNWGKFDYNNYINRYKKNKKKFLITGSPRLDLWKKKISDKIFKSQIDQIKKYKKFVLIASSGVSSLNEFKKRLIVDRQAKKLRNQKEIKKKNIEHMYEYIVFKKTVKLINLLARKFPNINFVIRKHPSESIKDWNKIIINFPKNVFFDNRFDVYGWISLSECIIHTASTVCLQAYYLKKKAISFVPKIAGGNRGFSNQFGIKASSEIKVLKVLDQILNKKKKFNIFNKKKNKIFKDRLFINSKGFASDIIVNDLLKISKRIIKRKDYKFLFFYSCYLYLRSYLSEIKHFLIGNKSEKPIQARRSIKEKIPGGLKKKEINKFYDNVLENNKIKIMQMGPNGFFISKKKS